MGFDEYYFIYNFSGADGASFDLDDGGIYLVDDDTVDDDSVDL